MAIQTSEPIPVEMADMIASSCRIDPADLYVLFAPNRSLVTAVQVAARIVEQSLHRLAEEGMDLRGLRYAYGLGVVPPLVDDDLISMGRINDSLLYGGISNVTVEGDDAQCAGIVETGWCPSPARPTDDRSSRSTRTPDGISYEIPIELHSPAELHLTNLTSGRTFSAGRIQLRRAGRLVLRLIVGNVFKDIVLH